MAYLVAGMAAVAALTYVFDRDAAQSELGALLAAEKDLDRLLARAYIQTSVDCPAKACLALQLRGESLEAVSEAMTSLDHVLDVHPELASHRVSGRTVPEIMNSVLAHKSLAAS